MSTARAKAKQPTRHVVGKVRLQEWRPGRWRIRYCDPATGRDVQLRLIAGTLTEAMQDAELHNRYVRGEVDTPPHEVKRQRKEATVLTVENALKAVEDQLNYGRPSMQNFQSCARSFVDYAEEQGVTRWKLVTRELFRKYYRYMKACELAHDSIRLRLLPIRLASAHWALESDQYTDEFRRAKINHKRPKGWEPPIHHLSIEQVQNYLQYLQDYHAPKYYAIACIAFFSGMRQLEITSLRACDVDMERRILTVTDTALHTTKTEQSKREIPVPEQVIDAIRAMREWPADREGLLFTTRGGNPFDAIAISKEWGKRIFPGAVAEGIIPTWFSAKKSRQTFASLAGEAGVEDVYLQRMMGHAPGSTLARFYRSISTETLRANLVKFWEVLTHKYATS